MSDALEAPAVHLSGKRGVAAMAEVERNNPLFKRLLLQDTPRATICCDWDEVEVLVTAQAVSNSDKQGVYTYVVTMR